MSNYNRFGAGFQEIIDLYPNSNVNDYGTQAKIETEMDRAVNRIVNAMPKRIHDLFRYRVTQEQLAGPAYGGEGPTFQLGLGPITNVTDFKIYRVTGNADGSPPRECPLFNADNQTGTLSGTGNQTLTLTGASTTLTELEYLYITYTIDPDDAAFSIPSFADYVVYSTAGTMGRQLFDQQTDTWELVTKYEQLAGDTETPAESSIFEQLKRGEFITDAVRALEFCNEIEASDVTIQSLSKVRG